MLRPAAALLVCLALAGCSVGRQDQLRDDGGKTVSPQGAPYSFVVPKGFTIVDNPSIASSVGASAQYSSAVALANRDLIIVTVYRLRQPVTPSNLEQARREFHRLLTPIAGKERATLSDGRLTRVGGDLALGFQLAGQHLGGDVVSSDLTFVFHGTTEVEVACQWKDEPARVHTGCASLLGSLRLS
jgi:hypothetical protein